MKRLLSGSDEQVAEWVAAKVPMMSLGDSPYTAIGLVDGRGFLVAGLVYSNFTRGDVVMHIALLTPRSLTRTFIREGFRYPFEQLGCRRVTVGVAASNMHSWRFVLKLGFIEEGRMREWFENGDDCVIFGMLRSECAWLGVKHGPASFPRTSADGRRGRTTTPLGAGTDLPPVSTDVARRHADAAREFASRSRR